MDQSIHELLLECDRLGEWEFPAAADYAANYAEVEALKSEIERIVGWSLAIDRSVQDASFLTDVYLRDDQYYHRPSNRGYHYYVFAFRFSNFGRMVTLHGGEWEMRLDELRLNDAIELLKARNYVYVPAEQLDAPYDGVNAPLANSISWWIRYFDYL